MNAAHAAAPSHAARGRGAPARSWLALAALLVLAAGLRFYAIDFGGGISEVRPDETGITYAASGDDPLRPDQLPWGGGFFQPLWLYMSAARHAGLAESPPPGVFAISERNRLAVRRWSAFLSTATVVVVWYAARRLTSRRWAWLAPALIAVAPLAVREAHFAKADSAAACAAALLVAALAAPRGRVLLWAAAVGMASGITASTKLTFGPLLGAALALARPFPEKRRWLDPSTVAIGAVVGMSVTALLHPFLLASPATLGRFAFEIFPDMMRHERWTGLAELPPAWQFYPALSLWYGLGHVAAIVAGPAVLLGLATRGPPRWIALAVLGHCAVLLANRIALARYFLQALPGLAVLIGISVERGVSALRRRSIAPRWANLGVALVVVGLIGQPLLASLQLVRLLGRPDTRAQAAQWIARNVPAGAKVALYGGPTAWTGYGNPPLGDRQPLYGVVPGQWEAKGVTWVVSHSYPMPYASRPLLRTEGLVRVAVFDPFADGVRPLVVEPMDAFFLPLGRFSDVTRPGPRIEIFERR